MSVTPLSSVALDVSENMSDAAENQIEYTPDSLVRDFTALLNDIHYQDIMEILDVGSFQVTRRKTLKREFRALYIGLWRLALLRSFPTEHDAVFHAFMEQEAAHGKNRREKAATANLVLQYVDKLREYGDTDFSDVSRHVLSLLEFDETRTRELILKLALHFRRMYVYFFDNLL